jgi:tetratricopeptide (TPR) repeat protein
MKRAGAAIVAVFLAVATHGQTRIASDIEIRQTEEEARRASTFEAKVMARVNLGELRSERNESTAAQREFETALQLARDERDTARRARDLPRYALACSWSGVALARLDRGSEAFAVLEEATRYSADSPGVWNFYSVAMLRLGLHEKAVGAARISVAAAERRMVLRPTVHEMLQLNVYRLALANGLSDGGDIATDEVEQILRGITDSLDSDALQSLRKNLGKHEEFQILTAPTTDSGMYLSTFNRAHMRLAALYENNGLAEEARREYQAVVSRRSDEAAALAGLARLSSDPKERDRYLIQSLDANPFAADVVGEYERHVESGDATAAGPGGSDGSRLRLAIQQMHDRNFRGARETLEALLETHANNDVLLSLLARTALESGDVAAARAATGKMGDTALRAELEDLLGSTSARPAFLDKPMRRVTDPSDGDLRAVLSLFAGNALSAADRATLDQEEFSSAAIFDAPEGGPFERGTMRGVPFRFQSPARFRGISSAAKPLRLTYRILGATTVGERDALLIEPVRAEAEP